MLHSICSVYVKPWCLPGESVPEHRVAIYTPEDLAEMWAEVIQNGTPVYEVDDGDTENGPGGVDYLGHVWGHLRAYREDGSHTVETEPAPDCVGLTYCDGRHVDEVVRNIVEGPRF